MDNQTAHGAVDDSWREKDRRRFLSEFPTRRTSGVEVGVWKGGFAQLLLEEVDPSALYLVDPWAYRPERPDALYGGSEAASQGAMDAIYWQVLDRYSQEQRVKVVRLESEVAARLLPSVDWVYIDGDHTYDAVRTDLNVWWRRLKPGGFLCGDDYQAGGWFGDSVIRAVDLFAKVHGLSVETVGWQWRLV